MVAGRVRPAFFGCFDFVAAEAGGENAVTRINESASAENNFICLGKLCTLASFGPLEGAVNSAKIQLTLS